MLSSLKRYESSEVAVKRMEIINFYDEFGEKATILAFGANRKVISRWRKRLKENKGELSSLIPYSTRPKRIRTSVYDSKIVDKVCLPGQDCRLANRQWFREPWGV